MDDRRRPQNPGKAGAPPVSALGLARIGLLEGLPADVLEALAGRLVWQRCRAGHRVISRAARDCNLYLIVSGSVRVTAYSASGRQVTFRDIEAGGLFGELAAIDGCGRSADVVALTDALLAVMAPPLLWQLVRGHSCVCERLMRALAASVRSLSERVFDLATLGVQNRVHAEVLRLARTAEVRGNAARISPAPRHAEIASRVSTSREQVTRELSSMKRQGLIAGDARTLVVPDVARLERLVDEVRR